jgi:hypothetical protein
MIAFRTTGVGWRDGIPSDQMFAVTLVVVAGFLIYLWLRRGRR